MALGNGALHRLAAVTLAGTATPDLFEQIAGAEQDDATRPGAGWYHLYRPAFPTRQGQDRQHPRGHRWLGGDAGVLRDVLAKGR